MEILKFQPMVPLDVAKPADLPTGPDWVYSPVYNGQPMVAVVDARGERAMAALAGPDDSGAVTNHTTRFQSVAKGLVRAFRGHAAFLTGDMVAVASNGRQDPSLLKSGNGAGFMISDLLALDDEELMTESFAERIERLLSVMKGVATERVQPPLIEEAEPDIVKAFRAAKFGGIIARNLTAPYTPGARTEAYQRLALTSGKKKAA